ncbi:MAG: hypothetical protein DWH96_05040 [Planctomycetota bacterium]|nr:MAG: hypothetical protein DWH96_05040 [Planctomycetota bacterium]
MVSHRTPLLCLTLGFIALCYAGCDRETAGIAGSSEPPSMKTASMALRASDVSVDGPIAAAPGCSDTARIAFARSQELVTELRFDDFRASAKPYIATLRSMLPLDRKFADSSISAEERAQYLELDTTKNAQWRAVWKCIYEERWSIEDRGAMMQWLLFESNG